jgi:hypothetical protein
MWWHLIQHWLAIHTGTDNEPGPEYGFFSGFGSDLGQVTLIGGAFVLYRRHNCHVARCWRIGRIGVADGLIVCSRHHTEVTGLPRLLTIEHLRHLHLHRHGTPEPVVVVVEPSEGQ